MSKPLYLDMLDEMLRSGTDGLSDSFCTSQLQFVAAQQEKDGGFRGRQGSSDLYYTDFALRTLFLLDPAHPAFKKAADYVFSSPGITKSPPPTLVDCFSILNIRRMLKKCPEAVEVITRNDIVDDFDPEAIQKTLLQHEAIDGGFARSPGDRETSAYRTFLAALCYSMLDEELPERDNAIEALQKLKRPDGGYAEMSNQAVSQTNATAAAVAFLMMSNAFTEEEAATTIRFLANMQCEDGGFRAHAAAPFGDLLSSFTGYLTLSGIEGVENIDAAALGRFLRERAATSGGFLACDGDAEADVEYSYYGLGLLALLRSSPR